MWPYAAILASVLIAAYAFRREAKRRDKAIDVGKLSDAWLAEQRAQRNGAEDGTV